MIESPTYLACRELVSLQILHDRIHRPEGWLFEDEIREVNDMQADYNRRLPLAIAAAREAVFIAVREGQPSLTPEANLRALAHALIVEADRLAMSKRPPEES